MSGYEKCAVCGIPQSPSEMWQHWLDRHSKVLAGWARECRDSGCTERHIVAPARRGDPS